MRSHCRPPCRISRWTPVWHGGDSWRCNCCCGRAYRGHVPRRPHSREIYTCWSKISFIRYQVDAEFPRHMAGRNFCSHFEHSAFVRNASLFLSEERSRFLRCRQFPMQWLLILGTLGSCLGIAAYLFYVSLPSALLIEFLSGFLFAIGT